MSCFEKWIIVVFVITIGILIALTGGTAEVPVPSKVHESLGYTCAVEELDDKIIVKCSIPDNHKSKRVGS